MIKKTLNRESEGAACGLCATKTIFGAYNFHQQWISFECEIPKPRKCSKTSFSFSMNVVSWWWITLFFEWCEGQVLTWFLSDIQNMVTSSISKHIFSSVRTKKKSWLSIFSTLEETQSWCCWWCHFDKGSVALKDCWAYHFRNGTDTFKWSSLRHEICISQ